MLIINQINDFIGFFIIGIIIAFIFDFFRAYRKFKKISSVVLIIQDIIYFFIVISIITIGIINILDSNIRFYIFVAIILGSIVHFTFLSKFAIKMYKVIFDISKAIIEFILLPLKSTLYFALKICIFMKKIVIKCCKKLFFVLTFNKRLFQKINSNFLKKKTKEV